MRLSGFEIIAATRTAGRYDPSYPWRLVLHRTQGSTLAGAVAAYRSHQGWPHITASYREKRRAQHIDLGTAARALRNASGGEQTNLARCIQVELTGFSETPMSNAEADWVADQVIAPILAAVPEIRLHGPRFYDDNEGIVLATTSSPIRMSRAQWRAFDGICGHQHVPENTHWDPGRIPLDRILSRLGSSSFPAPKEGVLMALSDNDQKLLFERVHHIAMALQVSPGKRENYLGRHIQSTAWKVAKLPTLEQLHLVMIASGRLVRDEKPGQEVDLDELAKATADAARQAVTEALPAALAELTPEAVAAAVVDALPADHARRVVDELASRLDSESE